MLQINVVPDKSAVVVVHPTPGVGDATTIADALRMIPNGGDVHVRDGTYAISAGLTVPLNTKIVGAGRNKTIFNMTGAFTLFTTTGGYFCLSEVTVQGDNTSAQIVLNTNHDADIACSDFNQIKDVVTAVSSAAEVSMTDCYILLSALAGTGIYLWKGATDGVLRWDYVHMTVPITSATLVEGPTVGSAGCRWKVVQSYTGGSPPPVANFYYLQSVDWVNFKIDFAKVSILSDTNKIVGCDFQSCWIRLSPPFASKTLISGCNFELGGDDVGLWVAQLIIGSATSEVVVSGCQFRGNGVSFTGVYVYNSSDIAIDGCTFIAHTTAGVYLEASVPASSAVVTGCRFSEPTPVFENGPDCVGIYASNDGFSGSVLVGLRSTVDAENYRNVRTWGAKGDGTTDDVTAIQAAIAALPSGGGTLFFPPGTYKISSTLTMPNKPVKVMGCGDASVISPSVAGLALFTVPTGLTDFRNYVFEDLQFVGGGGATVPVGGALVGGTLNNTFASAPSITGGNGTFAAGSTVGFTKEVGEPATVAGNAGGKSGWLEWTAPASGTCIIDLSVSSFDTLLGVYTGVSVGALTLVIADDDGGAGTTSLVTFSAVMGTSYKIMVDGFSGASGSVTFTMTLTAFVGSGFVIDSIVKVQDVNSRGNVKLVRVNAEGAKVGVDITAGDTGFSNQMQIWMEDCWIVPVSTNNGALIRLPNSFFQVSLHASRVRFIDTIGGVQGGSVVLHPTTGVYINVNAYIVDSAFNIALDSTLGSLHMEDCSIYNMTVATDLFMFVQGSLTLDTRSALINVFASGKGISFNYNEQVSVVGGEYTNCAFSTFGNIGGSFSGVSFITGASFLGVIDGGGDIFSVDSCNFDQGVVSPFSGFKYLNLIPAGGETYFVSKCRFSALTGTTPTAAVTVVGATTGEVFITDCYFDSPNCPPWKETSSNACFYNGNKITSGSQTPVIIGADSRLNGVLNKTVSSGTTTGSFVDQFTHLNLKGILGVGTLKNTGANSMEVRETAIDIIGGATSTRTTTVLAGNSLLLTPMTNIGTVVPPYKSYAVAVRDLGVSTSFSLCHSTEGAQ